MCNSNYVLGVDVSKASLELCLMRRHDERILKRCSVNNVTEVIDSFLSSLSAYCDSPFTVAVEPTGSYWYPLADLALSKGIRVVSAPTRATRKFIESISERAKNDRIDAKGIARYACHMELHDYKPKPADIRHLGTLLAMRKKLSQTVSEYTQSQESMPEVADILTNTLCVLKEQLKELDSRIKKASEPFAASNRLRAVPGFGPVVTGALLTKLMLFDFKKSDSFVAYVGYDVKVRESGRYKGKRMLSHNGDPELRRLLYLAAQAAIKVKGSPFVKIYETHKARGLTTTESLCAVARKLARMAWSIVKYETDYDPSRVFRDLRAERAGVSSIDDQTPA
jgi:transposase